MKFKVKFPRIVTEAQWIEGIVEADDEDAVKVKVDEMDFQRFLIVKREARDITPGRVEFEPLK